jgi:hypothetical protein
MPSKNKEIGNHFGKSDLLRLGLFTAPEFISIGEPFASQRDAPQNLKGKQFLTAPIKKGHDSKDAYFGKTNVYLFENEPYVDQVYLRRRWRAQAKEKNISQKPFILPGLPPRPSGKGSHYGTIEQQWPSPKREIQKRPVVPEKKQKEPRNFLSCPPKRGGFGYANVTIGKPYEYSSDPYERPETLKRVSII